MLEYKNCSISISINDIGCYEAFIPQLKLTLSTETYEDADEVTLVRFCKAAIDAYLRMEAESHGDAGALNASVLKFVARR